MAKEDKKRKHKSQHDDDSKTSKKKHRSEKKSATQIVSVSSPSPAPTTTPKSTSYSAFSEIVGKLYVHLAPMWAGNVMEGVTEQLNAFLMKYVPQLDGIVLAHSDTELITEKGQIRNDSPFCHFFIRVKFLVWKPKKGTKLVGRINLQSQDHIGLLIFGTFNASIPKARIPSDTYEWRSSVDSSEEPVTKDQDEDDNEDENEDIQQDAEQQRSQYGEWINKSTGVPVGGDDGIVEFNVVDIIEANDILTVGGSL
ncbi:hypothetical protein RO3G_05052 [Lichtheimia corymbifera JMRC:FSU:9682]|uniref:RPA43 OB domain-containing protein n=1 Tax=Lichtheimia corymbifera JMRC:FSU:9682 TaxID=1263082 RepID=A0A068RS34_9FUNG|nr:hypothetical protein RO3G_05052 [Lichtheimia corymbifera JMRC:FSU:9682]